MRKGKPMLIILLTLTVLLSAWAITAFAEKGTAEEDQTEVEQDKNESESANEETEETEETVKQTETAEDGEEDLQTEATEGDVFPQHDDLQFIAENAGYKLKADSKTGHFIVENKQTGDVLRSFPNPKGWDEDKTADAWKLHLQSPFMFSYVEMNERKDMVKESNLLNHESKVDFQKMDDGFKVTYEIPGLGFVIPIEVQLKEDYVETKVLSDDIKDEKEFEKEDGEKDPMARLVSLRLFPFLGAETSENENGSLFLPDGSGVLVDFKKNRASTTNLYSERVYGDDQAFAAKTSLSSRLPVKMPVFGIMSEEQAILGVIHDGDAYSNIVSAPSESFSQYNWVTGEHLFRFKYFQPTNKQKTEGFFTYSKEMQRTERTIRYYMIDEENPDYVDMAVRYRQYLMEDQGLKRRESEKENLELHLNILGGGTKEGFIWDSFLPMTTTNQAKKIVNKLSSLNVEDMSITYHGWQEGGYGTYGEHFPVDSKLGGNDEMKAFADYVHSKGYSLYLNASTYTYNNTGKDGFRASRDGLRDLSSSVMSFGKSGDDVVLVSPRWMKDAIFEDLDKAKELGIDGYLYGDGIGSNLSTDYNENHFAKRKEVKQIQQDIINETKQTLGNVQVTAGNFYSLKNSNHIEQMENDYSYDLYVDKKVPFAQVALHGLVSYSFDYGNMSGNATESFLKGIEYGAEPSFLVTYEESHKLLELKSRHKFYSTYYQDWEMEIAKQYKHFNKALGDVQNQFITDHRKLADGVFETTYENGKRIIVNYNMNPYVKGEIVVEAEDFIMLEGGE